MESVKIIGSGSLHGQVTYGVEKHIVLGFKRGIALNFVWPVLIGKREASYCEFNIENGMAVGGYGIETDLLMVDPHDLPKLQNMYWRWMGENG